MRYHGLDSLRIIAEYFVVFSHLYILESHSPAFAVFAYDLINGFFVLSGCVSWIRFTYVHEPYFQNWNQSIGYVWKKLFKVLPLYYVLCIWRFISYMIAHQGHVCSVPKAICFFLDFLTVSGWTMCGRITIDICGVGWFLCILMWCWGVIPVLYRCKLHRFWEGGYVWVKIFLLYILNNLLSFVFYHVWRISTYYFTIGRLFQFVIGTGVAYTLTSPEKYVWSPICYLTIFLGLVFYLLLHYVFMWNSFLCAPWRFADDCQTHMWSSYNLGGDPSPCLNLLLYFDGKMSIVWAILIHLVASRHLLEFQIFKILNPLSFVVYLFHVEISMGTRLFLVLIGLKGAVRESMLIIWVYVASYYITTAYASLLSLFHVQDEPSSLEEIEHKTQCSSDGENDPLAGGAPTAAV